MKTSLYVYLCILFITLLPGPTLFAKSNTPPKENPFQVWSQCPKNVPELKTAIDKLSSHRTQFEDLKSAEKMKIAQGKDWRATYLLHIGSAILPSNILSDLAMSCWIYFKEMQLAVNDSNMKEAKEKAVAWSACLDTKFGPAPQELVKISNCVQNLYLTQGFYIPPGKYIATNNTKVCPSGEIKIMQEGDFVHISLDDTPLVKHIDTEKFVDIEMKDNVQCTFSYQNKSTTDELINTQTEICEGRPKVVRETTFKKGDNKLTYTVKVKVDKAPQVQTYFCELKKE